MTLIVLDFGDNRRPGAFTAIDIDATNDAETRAFAVALTATGFRLAGIYARSIRNALPRRSAPDISVTARIAGAQITLRLAGQRVSDAIRNDARAAALRRAPETFLAAFEGAKANLNPNGRNP